MDVDETKEVKLSNDSEENMSNDSADVTVKKKPKTKMTRKRKKLQKKLKSDSTLPHPVYKCVVCDKKFNRHIRFWRHLKDHPNYTCYICWDRFISVELLEKHNEAHPNQVYICDEQDCGVKFENCRMYVMHNKNEHKIENYLKCIKCDKRFSSHEQWDVS